MKKVAIDHTECSNQGHPPFDEKIKYFFETVDPTAEFTLGETGARQLLIEKLSGASGKSHRPKNVENYLLASHVFCALCGNRMHTIAEKGVPVYRCNKHMSIYDTGREPHILRIKTGHIDSVVWEDCCQVFERLSFIQDVLERSIEQSLQNMLEDTRGREMIDALQQEFAFKKIL